MSEKRDNLSVGDAVVLVFYLFVLNDVREDISWANCLKSDTLRVSLMEGFKIALKRRDWANNTNIYREHHHEMFEGEIIYISKSNAHGKDISVETIYKKQSSARIMVELLSGDLIIVPQNYIIKKK